MSQTGGPGDAVIERARKMGLQHEGIKVTGPGIDPEGERFLGLIDARDQADLATVEVTIARSEIAELEHIQVVDASEAMKPLVSATWPTGRRPSGTLQRGVPTEVASS